MGISNQHFVRFFAVGRVIAAASLLSASAFAQTVNMNDQGSTATIDLSSSAGMTAWNVNGVNQLNQQGFWYQTDGGIAQPISSISAPTYVTYNGLNGINEVTATYQNSQLKLSIDYYLQGGGVGVTLGDISESISAVNVSGRNMSLNLYQYSAFNLMQAGRDTVQIIPGDTFVHEDNNTTAILQAATTPGAFAVEAATNGFTLNRLNTVPNLMLDDITSAGPGIETWALQWNEQLAADQEFDLDESMGFSPLPIVPEPSTVAVFALGAGMLGLAFRRKAVTAGKVYCRDDVT